MSTTELNTATATQVPETKPLDMKLEVVILPVSDAERAKQFYASLGWREDADFAVQRGLPGPAVHAARLAGVDHLRHRRHARGRPGPVGEPAPRRLRHRGGARRADRARRRRVRGLPRRWRSAPTASGREPGPDPERKSYASYASFSDPDGNEWLLQEVTEPPARARATSRTSPRWPASCSRRPSHHDAFEKAAPPHDWWDWYAPYLSAREHGSTPEQATAAADRYMEEVHGVVVSR